MEQIHGESYLAAGYVCGSALDNLGRLDNSNPAFIWDRVRGSTRATDVLYLHAVPIERCPGRIDEGGLRIISLSAEGTLDDLGAFNACKASIGSANQRKLYNAIQQRGRHAVKEIAALSRTNDAHYTVSYALIRDALHRALYEQSGETWLINFAVRAYRKIRANIGDLTIKKIGEPFYAYRNADPRAPNEVLVIPTIVETHDGLDNIAHSIRAIDNPEAARKLLSGLRFMTQGLPGDFLSPLVREVLREGASA